MFVFLAAESPPVAITPDFGGPGVAYADGVFDTRFNRYITIREGTLFLS